MPQQAHRVMRPRDAIARWFAENSRQTRSVYLEHQEPEKVVATVRFDNYDTPPSEQPSLGLEVTDVEFMHYQGRGQIRVNLPALYDDLGVDQEGLETCAHTNCEQESARYVYFPSIDRLKEYCSDHVPGAEDLKTGTM